jgi:hypothetical protein
VSAATPGLDVGAGVGTAVVTGDGLGVRAVPAVHPLASTATTIATTRVFARE